MDLGFSRTLRVPTDASLPEDAAPMVDLPILLAVAAARQASSPTVREMASVLRGQEEEGSKVQTLAGVFAPRQGGKVDAACLEGSFNPLFATHRTVGTDDERGVYLGDSADVQGSDR
jgi:hypothetical protein